MKCHRNVHLRPFGLRTGLTGLLFLATGAAVFACPASNVFQDNFTELNPVFKTTNNEIQVRDKKLIVQTPEGLAYPRIYNNDIYDRVEVCTTISTDKSQEGSNAGLIFWAKSYNSYYVFLVTPATGTALVARRVNGTWLHPIPSKEFAAIKRGDGETNEIRVAVDGGRATLYVNDQKFATLLGTAPEGGGQVGIDAEAPEKTKSTWTFSDFGVSKLRASANPPLPAGPVIDDNFAKLQSTWTGNPELASWLSLKENKLMVQLPQNISQNLNYSMDAYSSGEIRVKISLEACQDASLCSGGLVFWSTPKSNYSLNISPLTGKVYVARYVDGRYLYPVSERECSAVKKGLGQINEVRVVFNGSQATAYINDQKFASLDGQAPEDGGVVGMTIQSPTASPAAWSLSEFKLVR
jgi:hypothetical protein